MSEMCRVSKNAPTAGLFVCRNLTLQKFLINIIVNFSEIN